MDFRSIPMILFRRPSLQSEEPVGFTAFPPSRLEEPVHCKKEKHSQVQNLRIKARSMDVLSVTKFQCIFQVDIVLIFSLLKDVKRQAPTGA